MVKTFSPTILGALDSAYTTSSPIRVPQFFRRTLVDVWRANGDPSDTPRWIPIPAFAKAIKRTWADRTAWNHFGRPPAIPDIVEHERTGILARSGKPEDLAAALTRLLSSEELRHALGQAGRERFMRDYTDVIFRKRFFKSLEDIADANGSLVAAARRS